MASDDSFLQQFDYSDADRLTSIVRVSRTRDDDYVELGTVGFQSLREDEDTATVPFVFPEFTYRRLIEAPLASAAGSGSTRKSLGILRDDGTNMVRAGGGIDWRRQWTAAARACWPTATARGGARPLPGLGRPGQPDGFEARGMPTVVGRAALAAGRARPARAEHVIEPIAQVIYSDDLGETDVPNEDSQLPEFDETNLFSLNRFPGQDRLETGLRANLGVSYTRYDPAGWSVGADARPGDPRRARAGLPRGHAASPGAGRTTSARVYARLRHAASRLVNRALFDTELDFRRNEFALAYDSDRAPGCARPTSISPRTTTTRSSGRSRRPTSSRSTPATASARTGRCAGSGATTSPARQQPARRRRDHLRQRVRRVRPFGLAPLHLID